MLATWWGGPSTHGGSSGGEPTSHIGFRSASVLERKPKGFLHPQTQTQLRITVRGMKH